MTVRSDDPSTQRPWVAYAAAGWAAAFAAFHLLWAAGVYVGLDAVQARAAFAKPAFLAYDLFVAAMCVAAVPIALALGTPRDRAPGRVVVALAWIGTTLLVLRAAGGVAQAVYESITGAFSPRRVGIWEPWFVLGAVLFSLNLWRYRRRTP